MNSLKKKFVLILTLILSVLMGSVMGVLFTNYKNKIYAEEAAEPTVAKIRLFLQQDDLDNDNPIYYALYYDELQRLSEIPVDINDMSSSPFLTISKDNIYKGNEELNKQDAIFIQEYNKDDDVFMLKNANYESVQINDVFEENATSGIQKTYYVKEFILVQFQPTKTSASLLSLSINAKLNDTQNISPLDKTTGQQEILGYSQVFDLNNIYKLDTSQTSGQGDKINEFDAQGKYEFTFTYNLRNNGVVTTNNQKSIIFNVLNEKYYINPNNLSNQINPRDNVAQSQLKNILDEFVKTQDTAIDEHKTYYSFDENTNGYIEVDTPSIENLENYFEYNENASISYNHVFNQNLNINNMFTEPRLFNTERIDKGYYNNFGNDYGIYSSEKNYFYFSNQSTTDYDGNATTVNNPNYLQYPTLKYDASRYNLSYTKTMYGITTFVTTALDKNNNKLILYYENQSQSWQEELDVENDNSQYIATIQFEQIGKYILSFNFVLNDTIINYDVSKKLYIDKENWDLIHSNELSIFGYQLMHSEYKSATGETEKEMKYISFENDIETSIYADVTNLNFNINTFSTDDINLSNPEYPVKVFEKIAKTNQAPLFFRYYATLESSTCFYFKKINNSFVYQQTLPLTSNTRFTDNGLYVVLLNYTYNDYELIKDFKQSSGKDNELKQLFVFEIENIEPDIEFFESEYNIIEPIKFIEVKNQDIMFDVVDISSTTFDRDKIYELYEYYFEITEDSQYVEGKEYYSYDENDKDFHKINIETTTFDPDNTFEKVDGLENIYDRTRDDSFDSTKTYYVWNIQNLYTFNDGEYVAVSETDRYDVYTTYYIKNIHKFNSKNSYEKINGKYVLTEDDQYLENKTYYEKLRLATGGYTNNDVEINWQDALSSPFDVKPNITIYSQSFDSNSVAIDITNRFASADYSKGKIEVNESKIYSIKVEYGPCTYAYSVGYGYRYIYSASVTYTFIIDKEEIGEGENVVKFYKNYRNGFKEISQLTNRNFALIYGTIDANNTDDSKISATGTKRSGAKINVSYSYLPFSDVDINKIDSYLVDNLLIVPNGKNIQNQNNNIAYNSTSVNGTFNNDSNILKSDGVYIFTFADMAGNTTTKYMIKDSTAPALIQKINGLPSFIPSSSSNVDNMVNIDTEIIWGNQKAIKIELNNQNNYEIAKQLFDNGYQVLINSGKTYYFNQNNQLTPIDFSLEFPNLNDIVVYNEESQNYEQVNVVEGDYYILIGIESKKINQANSENQFDNIPESGVTIYYKDNNGNYVAPNNSYNQNPDYKYLIKATDENGNYLDDEETGNEHLFKIRLYDSLGNSFEGLVEMTFDKSQLKAEVSGMPEKNIQIINSESNTSTQGSGVLNRLNINEVSNKKTIAFSWISGGENFEVTKVECEFYPLTFELKDSNQKLNLNYPYSSNYSNKFNLMLNTTTERDTSTMNGQISESTRTKTGFINLVQDSRYGDQASVEGMYKITRTYAKNGGSRDYYFYIDRNNIISYDENILNNYIGQGIKIIFGDSKDSFTFAGSDFLQDFVNDYIFLTNRQPGNINVQSINQKQVKYFIESVENISYIDNEKGIDFNGNIADALSKFSKINVNRLNIITSRNNIDEKIDFEDNYLIDFSDDLTTYQITIYDGSNSNIEFANQIKFEVAVNLNSPEAEFVDNDTNIALHEDTNNYISKNSTNVSLVWNVDESGINAKIDENNIIITQTLENGRKNILYSPENTSNITNIVSAEGNKRIINFNKFNEQIDGVNCKVEITLRYLTNSDTYYREYLSTTKIIMFDYEKPQLNFTNIFNNDKYLQKSNITKSQFENYEETISFDNYAFVVDNSYSLSLPTASSFWQKDIVGATTNPNDVQSVWFRQYNKYFDDSGINQQSIVPGDDRYDDSTKAPTRLRFNPNLFIIEENNSTLAYTAITTTLDKYKFEDPGYYEIIEKDCAGNYRIYTIQVLPNSNIEKETIEYTETIGSGETQTTIETFTDISSGLSHEINNQKVIFTGFKNLGDWMIIDLYNGDNQNMTETMFISPLSIDGQTTLSQALSQINELIVDEEKTGKLFTLKITTSKYLELTIDYRTPGQKYELDTSLRATSLTLTIDPNKYESTYLKELHVYEIDKISGDKVALIKDSNDQDIDNYYYTDKEVKVYVFTYSAQNVRNLWFEYKDNFGVEYKENIILGITQTPFDEMILFNGNYLTNENYSPISVGDITDFYKYAEYYSNSQVIFEYQPIIYKNINLYLFDENNTWVPVDYTATPVPSKNIERISIFQPLLEGNMKDARYIITFEDTSGKNYQFSLHHYTKIADLHFIDSSNFEHYFDIDDQETYEYSVSRVIYLEYQKFDMESSYNVQTVVTAKRIYTDSNNVTLTKDYGIIDNEFVFNEFGQYIITATNELGSSKIYKFELIKSDAIYYSVKANANGKTILLSPSEVKYSYNGEIDHYVSIYDVTVDANQEKSLKVEEITKNQIVTTRIFRIYSTNANLQYEKYIAVSKIAVSSNILDDMAKIIETKIENNEEHDIESYLSGKYLKTNAKQVVLSIPSYFRNEANLLKLRVVYEDKDLGFVSNYEGDERIELKLSVAGQYKIYVYDLAGNQQSFGGTSYFELSLINNFIYKLNGERGIYNSIYNSAVSLSIEKQSNFLSNNTGSVFTITCTHNGETFNPTYSNGVYIFDSYGTYYITLKGYLNKDNSGNLIDEVVTQIKFTILNANEARLMHEYIGLNGYEVTKIMKNNTDVTDLIKESLGTSTINKFALSGVKDAIGGSGVYEITVTAILDDIVGESQFTYSVWINNDKDLLIIPSIKEGTSTTKNITLQANLYQIYSKIGECELKVNGNTIATINEASASSNTITTFTISSDNRHVVTLETLGGNTIMSFVVTKVEPLNSIAIIVIVIASLVVTGLTITFILFRKKMRVR